MQKYTAVLILSSFAAAQQTQLPDVIQTRLHTVEGWKIRVENHYSYPIDAMHLMINCPTTAERMRFGWQVPYDHLLNYPGDSSVAPGAFFDLPFQKDALDCEGGLDAVIFTNGYSNGAPEAVQDIYRRRQGVAKGLAYALPLVERVALAKSSPADVAKALRDKGKTDFHDASKNSAERLGEMNTLTFIAGLLERQTNMLVPSDRTPKRQPGIQETMQVQGLTREQAHAIVLKRKLEEWNADLQGNLDPPSGK